MHFSADPSVGTSLSMVIVQTLLSWFMSKSTIATSFISCVAMAEFVMVRKIIVRMAAVNHLSKFNSLHYSCEALISSR